LVEAKVSVDRVQGFLLEPEKRPVPAYPLKKTGAWMHKATLVWEGAIKRKPASAEALIRPLPPTLLQRSYDCVRELGGKVLVTITCGRVGEPPVAPVVPLSSQLSVTGNPLLARTNSASSVATTATGAAKPAAPKPTAAPPLTEDEFLSIVREAHVIEAEKVIADLEQELVRFHKPSTFGADGEALDAGSAESPLMRASSFVESEDVGMRGVISPADSERSGPGTPLPAGAGKDARVLTLSRVSLQARAGQLISVVGPVGSGKSSLLSALLGDMRYFTVFATELFECRLNNFILLQVLLWQRGCVRKHRLRRTGGLHPELYAERQHRIRQPLRRSSVPTDPGDVCAAPGY
jgi:ABC-type multidrug transport system fused ATPase/permease subunit